MTQSPVSPSEAATSTPTIPAVNGAFLRATDIVQEGRQNPRWIVENLIAPDLTLWHGVEGVGKSTLVVLLAAALATGEEYLAGWRVETSTTYRVGILTGYPSKALETARRLTAHDKEAARDVLIATVEASRTEETAYWNELAAQLRSTGPGTPVLFVDDAFSIARPGATLNGEDGALLVARLAELASTGVAVVLVHHATKTTKGPQGSRAFEAVPSLVVGLEAARGDNLNVNVAKSNLGAATTYACSLQFVDGRPVLTRR